MSRLVSIKLEISYIKLRIYAIGEFAWEAKVAPATAVDRQVCG